MLQTQTVEADTLELLKTLMKKNYLHQFVLVGGTALSLQLGRQKNDVVHSFFSRFEIVYPVGNWDALIY